MHQSCETGGYYSCLFFTMVGTLPQEILEWFSAMEKKREYGVPIWFLLCLTTRNILNCDCVCKFCSYNFSNRIHLLCNAPRCWQLQLVDCESQRDRFFLLDVLKNSSYLPVSNSLTTNVPFLLFLDHGLSSLFVSDDSCFGTFFFRCLFF